MVLALYIFGYHTNLQVIVPVLIIRIIALYKLTGVCLLFSYTWIGQQTNHLISVEREHHIAYRLPLRDPHVTKATRIAPS